MKTFANNDSGLLPSIQFFDITFHTKIFQTFVFLVRFYLLVLVVSISSVFSYWCYQITFALWRLRSVVNDAKDWQLGPAGLHQKSQSLLCGWDHAKCSVRVVWCISEGKFNLLRLVFFTVHLHAPWSSHLFLCGKNISRFKCYILTKLKMLFFWPVNK